MQFNELTYLSTQWLPTDDPPLYGFWMASSEVDQKFLGHFAKTTSIDNNYLSRYDLTAPANAVTRLSFGLASFFVSSACR